MDVVKCEPFNKSIVLADTYKDEKALMKKVREVIDTENVKAVSIVLSEEVETLRGMDENVFLANSIELDKETRKPIKVEAEAVADAEAKEN